MKLKSYILGVFVAGTLVGGMTSCDDMLEMESDFVVYADQNHLTTPADTVNSVLGILNKLQAVGVRTNLLGELRGDLVKVSESAHADLKELANFDISDENIYNSPRDYYNVINNCNYYLAHADTTLMNNRNEKIFEREYAAVRSIRAWTYLQLAITYGRVPLVTQPILTESQGHVNYPMMDIAGVCEYFIKDLQPYRNVDLPNFGNIDDRISPYICFFPVNVVLGDLNLWLSAYNQDVAAAKDAALCYYSWIAKNHGEKAWTRTSWERVGWGESSLTQGKYYGTDSWSYLPFASSAVTRYGRFGDEVVSIIPMDSASYGGNYNLLRGLYNSTYDNNYKASILPSDQLRAYSAAQVYCGELEDGSLVFPAASDIEEGMEDYIGDLRFARYFSEANGRFNGADRHVVYNTKMGLQDIYIYRVSQIYLRLAEALNHSGYPRMAFEILSRGLNNTTIEKKVLPYCRSLEDTLFVQRFDFPNVTFVTQEDGRGDFNTLGIHSRGSGNTAVNPYYLNSAYQDSTLYPKDPLDVNFAADSIAWHNWAHEKEMPKVDSLIDNEQALELCFEGHRYYDLMRMALWKGDAQYLADKVSKRGGVEAPDGTLFSRLSNRRNWFLSWKGQIGY